ncbi:superoxide dismutase family protein [Clostridium subterminale]|uniref:Superoxide dismutase family protein n=2 Tax=Clostridium TaxID=1485 RepID=A0ABN1KUZ6_CLOSU
MRMANDKFSISDIISDHGILEPTAFALIEGGPLGPEISGKALFYPLSDGIFLRICVNGIPKYTSEGKPSLFHGFHIHEFGNCSIGNPTDPFMSAGTHWNPTNQPHPYHYGDLPPLISSNGTAVMSVYLSRFSIPDIIGKALIIHENADDFASQPAGNSGKKLACGVIMHT